MKIVVLNDRKKLFNFLIKNAFSNIYCIGDLDDAFWNYTTWYGLEEKEELKAVALLYTKFEIPVLLTTASVTQDYNHVLISSIADVLPKKLYSHLHYGVESIVSQSYEAQYFGEYYQMALRDKVIIDSIDTSSVQLIDNKDLESIHQLYNESYEDNWFDETLIKTNQYFGIKDSNKIVSIAGVHVYSGKYKVAALGNITTHPDFRNTGLGRKVTAKLIKSLSSSIDYIGLNVKADNKAAISCYEKLGFEVVDSYKEYMFNQD